MLALCPVSLCPELETPENGSVRLNGSLTAGTEALFSCSPGHKLLGEPLLVCELGGRWSGPPPRCQLIDCGLPPEPEHGLRELEATFYGSLAAFGCEDDYLMIGSEERECQEDGRWSGEDAYCERESQPPLTSGSEVLLDAR